MSTNMEKVPVYVSPEMKKQIDAAMVLANSHSRSDFCREALAFYIGYLNHSSTVDYLAPLLAEALKSEVRSSTKFICETIYKLAVEQAIQKNLLAAMNETDAETLGLLRSACEKTVAQTNGILTAEAAARWQNG